MVRERTAENSAALTTVGTVSTVSSSLARRARAAALVGGMGALFVLAGCGDASIQTKQNTWSPHGKYARSIDHLQEPVFMAAGVVGVLVLAAVAYCVLKFRRRPGHESVPHQSHGNPKVEIGLTALSAAILLGVAVPTVNTLLDISDRPADTAIEVTVVGQQWWWEFQYTSPGLEGIVTATELVLPTHTKVRLNITSRDVIHSFWIPKLNGKKDAVPNRVQPLNLEATDVGIYEGQCTRTCASASWPSIRPTSTPGSPTSARP
jgi:cytochrome c oxidase subunit II